MPTIRLVASVMLKGGISAPTGWEEYTTVSNRLLDHYTKLNMNSTQAMLVIHLLRFERNGELPILPAALLGKRMNLKESAIRFNIRGLERMGLLKRYMVTGNLVQIDLNPLFEKLNAKFDVLNTGIYNVEYESS